MEALSSAAPSGVASTQPTEGSHGPGSTSCSLKSRETAVMSSVMESLQRKQRVFSRRGRTHILF